MIEKFDDAADGHPIFIDLREVVAASDSLEPGRTWVWLRPHTSGFQIKIALDAFVTRWRIAKP